MKYLSLEEASNKYKKGNYSDLILKSLENYYRTREDVWIDDTTLPSIKIRLDWILNKITSLPKSSNILDVGSWTGAIANHIYNNGFTNIDCLEICKSACTLGSTTFPHLKFINDSIYSYKSKKKYDIIIVAEILEHLHNPLTIIKNLKNMLSDNGMLLITVPTLEVTFKNSDDKEHIVALEKTDLEELGSVEVIKSDDWQWNAVTIINKSKNRMNPKWRIHMLGFPNYKIGWEKAPNNPFNTKLIYLAKMMKDLGHEVIVYGVEGSDAPYADEFVPIVAESTFNKVYSNRDKNAIDNLYEESGPTFEEFNNNGIREIEKRIKDPGKEFLINFLGYVFKPITDVFWEKLICLEPGIGHNGSYLQNRIFESYAWQNHVYGKECKPQQSFFPNNYDTVIPAYFDPADYPFVEKKSDYYVYIGRIIWGKGVTVAVEITRTLGAELIVIGGGNVKETMGPEYTGDLSHVTQTGVLSLKDKVKYLSNAKGLIYYSLYVEPFGHAPIEAMMCGTPVLTSDFGAFTETNIHGLTGYRANTNEEVYWGIKNFDKLDPKKIREYAVKNYGLDRIKLKFQEHFSKLYGLRTGQGWYSIDKENPKYLEHLIKYIPC
jgi:glycosyltransferase involved in cell wall biosynthesis